jgi:RNA polymerase sigma-70 factor (ECF subfamily)
VAYQEGALPARTWRPRFGLVAFENLIGTRASTHLDGVRFPTRYLAAGLAPSIEASPAHSDPLPQVAPVAEMTESVRIRRAVERHLGLVWRVARRAGLGPEDAEDAAQHAFLILSQRLGSVPLRAEGSFLVATVLRLAADLRRLKWNTSVDGRVDPDEHAAASIPPDEALDRRRALVLLSSELEALDESERMPFVLVEIEQLSRAEAAKILGIPEGTVASRLRKARARLEHAFAKALGARHKHG